MGLEIHAGSRSKKLSDSQKFVLHVSFAVVHAVSLNVTKADVPAARFEEISSSLNGTLAEEDLWIKHVLEL